MKSKYEELKSLIDLEDFAESELDKPRTGYVCPHCGSGSKTEGTGALGVMPDGRRYYCFACKTSGDVFDLAGAVSGLETPEERYEYVSNWADAHPDARVNRATVAVCPDEAAYRPHREEEADLVRRSRQHIGEPVALAYLESRGIVPEVAQRWRLGYDRDRRRIVIPFPGSDYYHIDRSVDPAEARKYLKPPSDQVGGQPIWGPCAFSSDYFFVVEGPFDAMAVSECGHPAVALCGVAFGTLVAELNRISYDGTVIVCLDADETGRSNARDLASQLRKIGIRAHVADISSNEEGAGYAG